MTHVKTALRGNSASKLNSFQHKEKGFEILEHIFCQTSDGSKYTVFSHLSYFLKRLHFIKTYQ